MATQENTTNAKKLTVKFKQNYNKKLYGNYFTSIRAKGYGLNVGDLVDIVLNDNKIMYAKVNGISTMKFHEIPHQLIMIDTGMDYGYSLELFLSFGYDIKNFDLEVDYIFFETVQVYQKKS